MSKKVLIIGGGAAGFFTAVNLAEQNDNLEITILEKNKDVLNKVKISGGGRCNVSHAEFIPNELTGYYPRGEKELLGPFHTFLTGDTMAWFEERGVELKIEDDGRIFPVSNSSQTIIDCFLNIASKHNVRIHTSEMVKSFTEFNGGWIVNSNKETYNVDYLVLTTGSSPKMWNTASDMGIKIVDPVPSLFTFNIKDERLDGIPGVVKENVEIQVEDTKLVSYGPLLVTHWGLSGPAILKLSAFGALELAKFNYNFSIRINFVGFAQESCTEKLIEYKNKYAKKNIGNTNVFEVPKRLWTKLLQFSNINLDIKWSDLNKNQVLTLSKSLTASRFNVKGKSTFKDEFVTAGGVDLREVNFKTFESKKYPNLFLAGEVLNIDGVTGGFNFQSAWTGGYLIAKHLTSELHKTKH